MNYFPMLSLIYFFPSFCDVAVDGFEISQVKIEKSEGLSAAFRFFLFKLSG